MLTAREQQILSLIREDSLISQQAIADSLGISRSAVAGHVMNLTSKGIIAGRAYVINEAPFVAAIGGMNMDIHGRPEKTCASMTPTPGPSRCLPVGSQEISPKILRDWTLTAA